MMKIAEHFANESDCLGLVTGESIGQVASQTMHSLLVTNAVCELPVIRPLIGFDKQEIIDISEKIGTYETSILPFEDCCTIFVAKHPVTKPSLNQMVDADGLVAKEIIDAAQAVTNHRGGQMPDMEALGDIDRGIVKTNRLAIAHVGRAIVFSRLKHTFERFRREIDAVEEEVHIAVDCFCPRNGIRNLIPINIRDFLYGC